MSLLLSTHIKYLKGIGPVKARTLSEDLKISSVGDLLAHYPYKHTDRTRVWSVCDLSEGASHLQLRGRIVDVRLEGEGMHSRLTATFSDGTGFLSLIWFRSVKTMQKKLEKAGNAEWFVFGRPSLFNGRFSIAHPELEPANSKELSAGSLDPQYHTTERMKRFGLTSRALGGFIRHALSLVEDSELPETLPPTVMSDYGLMPFCRALRTVHFPDSPANLSAAMHRMKFEELFFLQLHILLMMQRNRTAVAGHVFARVGPLFHQFYSSCLPFSLTEAQKRVMKEIRADLGSGRQMNRLLQGDVGSGKTIVALLCALLALDNGFQACIMAPTEILASQHHRGLSELCASLPVRVELLTGHVKGVRRREILAGLADGSVSILVGTHALIEDEVRFQRLGLAIIDEQHRFGVKQRSQLWKKSDLPPHVLVMTATPIPRTLAMTVYGDLDVSVIDSLPPGRTPVKTLHFGESHIGRVYDGIRRQLAEGRQVYVVYPLVEESSKLDLADACRGFEELCDIFSSHRVGLVHGRMTPEQKDVTMQAFTRGEIHILVSTTVIEVGVNVPNASVMVIRHAERFGLAQLHQLRGRVGRGAAASFCLLVTPDRLSGDSERRIQVITSTTDGFVVAEEDLRLRGPGDMEGTAQSGLPFRLKAASLASDGVLLEQARRAAASVVAADPDHTLPAFAPTWRHLRELENETADYSSIS